MTHKRDPALVTSDMPEILRKIRARTPARLLVGRAGAAYRTGTQMDLLEAHAAARDAVRDEINVVQAFGAAFVEHWNLFEVQTKARLKNEYLLRPDLGRHFDDESRAMLQNRCSQENDLQIAIGDGLSVPAVVAQVPLLLPLLWDGAKRRNWKIGQAFVIRHCRVGILNEIGDLLKPRVAVLLIGERPGLTTVESLSAYMAYQPSNGHTDANRNLVSNIHRQGLSREQAATRILNVAVEMMSTGMSGYLLKERPLSLEDQNNQ